MKNANQTRKRPPMPYKVAAARMAALGFQINHMRLWSLISRGLELNNKTPDPAMLSGVRELYGKLATAYQAEVSAARTKSLQSALAAIS